MPNLWQNQSLVINVGILGLHLVANEFTFTDLGSPSRVLVLDVNHRSVKVLQVSKGKHRGVFYQLECQWHAGRRQGYRAGELQTLVLDKRTLCAQPADADGVEFAIAGGRDLLRLDGN